MGMMRACILAILAIFFLMGCATNVEPNASALPTGTQGAANANEPAPITFSLGQEISRNESVLTVLEWGFSPMWGSSTPEAGAKYLWIEVTSTNTGGIPKELPQDFSVEYRGTAATPASWNANYADIYERCHTECPLYPGVENHGYILFEVPENLEGGEGNLLIDVYGQPYKMPLVDPVEYDGLHLTVKNATLQCKVPSGSNPYDVICTSLDLGVKNERPWPIIGYKLKISNFTIDEKPWAIGVQGIASPDLKPYEETTLESGAANVHVERGQEEYKMSLSFKEWVPIGKPGDTVEVGFIVTYEGSEGISNSRSAQLVLPVAQGG